ncbi:MAG: cytochrome c oxidase subunit II [Actinomycetota bacterium]
MAVPAAVDAVTQIRTRIRGVPLSDEGAALTRNPPRAAREGGRFLFLLAIPLMLGSCSGPGNMLDPGGPGARRIAGLWWLMLVISVIVFLIVLGFIAAGLVRGRRNCAPNEKSRLGGTFVLLSGIVLPCLILGAVFLVSLRDMSVLSAPPDDPSLTIDVIAHDWWWEVRYPDTDAVTANEIHVPAGESVRLRLTTDDVIHSFWVPRLQAKTDHIPGTTTTMWLRADEPGRYRGQCAEFCGLQHANMIFWVEADPRPEFDEWLASQSEPAQVTGGTGEETFTSLQCAGCHTVRGTEADAKVGPDLTHVMSRGTLLSGVLDNSRDGLERVILDPQGLKPGITMPPSDLSEDDLESLLDYLEQLR